MANEWGNSPLFQQCVGSYLVWSELTGAKKTPQDIIEIIKTVEVAEFLRVSAALSNYDRDDSLESECKNAFYEQYTNDNAFYALTVCRANVLKDIEAFQSNLNRAINSDGKIYTRQELYLLTKLVFKYGIIDGTLIASDDKRLLTTVISLCLMIADCLSELPVDDLPLEMARNYVCNQNEDIAKVIARTYSFWREVTDSENCEQKFIDKYGVDLSTAIVLMLIGYFFTNNQNTNGVTTKVHALCMNNYKLSEAEKRFLSGNMKTAEEFRYELKELEFAEIISKSWDFCLLKKYPFVKLNDDWFIPINTQETAMNLFLTMDNMVSDLYEEENRVEFRKRLGEYFENHLCQMLSCSNLTALTSTGEKYKYKKDNLEPSDYITKIDDTLIVFEMKYRYSRERGIYFQDDKLLRGEYDRLFKEPLVQINKRLQEMATIDKYKTEIFSDVGEIFCIAVSISGIPWVPPLVEEYLTGLGDKMSINEAETVKLYHYCFSIEDLEVFCTLVEQCIDVVGYLRSYETACTQVSFEDHIRSFKDEFLISKLNLRTKYIKENYDKYGDSMREFFREKFSPT
ncbi:MAG: hypothetical protein WCV63_06370 [Negativicutes bacterium]|jgi:hypothetical protein